MNMFYLGLITGVIILTQIAVTAVFLKEIL